MRGLLFLLLFTGCTAIYDPLKQTGFKNCCNEEILYDKENITVFFKDSNGVEHGVGIRTKAYGNKKDSIPKRIEYFLKIPNGWELTETHHYYRKESLPDLIAAPRHKHGYLIVEKPNNKK